MTRLPKFQLRRWAISLTPVILWIIISTAWSWFLVNKSFETTFTADFVTHTEQLAQRIATQLQTARTLTPDQSPASRPAIDLADQPDLQAAVDEIRRLEPNLTFAMVWTEEGKVVAHTRRELRGSYLASAQWPDLDPRQSLRVRRITLHDPPNIPPVLEVTVPLELRGKSVGYVTLAWSQDWLDAQFLPTQGRLLIFSGLFTLIGLILILLATHYALSRIQRSRREIQQTARARTSLLTERGMLASVLAHEVRSPLTALRFNLHSLRTLLAGRSTDLDRQLELTDRCEREIRRLDGMLVDFLQRTQVIGPVESASVNTVISEAIEFLRPALERKHIHISVHLDSSNPLVHVHPDELRQVILNLAANAQDAMPKGGTLAVSTIAEEPPSADSPAPLNGQSVTILIRDSGTGIPPDLHERIFEPFFSTKQHGSGLGLALVRRVISGAGGTVACDSVVGEGTTFRLLLPRAADSGSSPLQPGHGYAHVRREDPTLQLDDSPELVIDQQEKQESAVPKQETSTSKPEDSAP